MFRPESSCAASGRTKLAMTHVSFTADARHVRTVSMEARARLSDARTVYPVTSALRHDEWWEVPEVTVPMSRDKLQEFARHCKRPRPNTGGLTMRASPPLRAGAEERPRPPAPGEAGREEAVARTSL